MINLIIPMAGKSTRFPGVRPKWMLTHPSGKFMALKAISGLKLDDYNKIYFIYLKEHENEYNFLKGFKAEIDSMGIGDRADLICLDSSTSNQPETVYKAILKADIKGQIFIKDSDNIFNSEIQDGNFVCVHDLNECGLINPSNKSYVIINDDFNIVNIIEKKVISSFFCVGGYSFADSSIFLEAFDDLKDNPDIYISDLIYQCMLNGYLFKAKVVSNYKDWGTLKDWDSYKRTYATLFVDLDGTLIHSASAHFPPYYGQTEIIKDNIDILKELSKSGKFEIVITTSRHEKYREITINQLSKAGLKFDHLIMGLQHSKRIIINDYALSNPYKSCDAINIRRNSTDLREMLKESLGVDFSEI